MVALAPAIGALVGVGAIALLRSDMPVVGRAVAAAGHTRHRGLGVRAARPDADVAAVAALDRPARRAARRGGRVRRPRPDPRSRSTGGARRRRVAGGRYERAGAARGAARLRAAHARARRRARRAARVLARHGEHHAHGLDPERRAGGSRGVRRRPGGAGGGGPRRRQPGTGTGGPRRHRNGNRHGNGHRNRRRHGTGTGRRHRHGAPAAAPAPARAEPADSPAPRHAADAGGLAAAPGTGGVAPAAGPALQGPAARHPRRRTAQAAEWAACRAAPRSAAR